MSLFDPLRDFFQRRQIVRLDALASGVQLVNLHSESPRGSFVFPGTDVIDHVEVDGQRVGQVEYSINPLRDRLYIDMIEVSHVHQRQGIGLSVLWRLWQAHNLPIVPLDKRTSSNGFWSRSRARLGAAGALIDAELRGFDQLQLEQRRWQHLVPESVHERRMRAMKASSEWPAIKARMEKEYGR
ncbi:GNAT family N-acetyltransferase [Pseudomonas koreensis]